MHTDDAVHAGANAIVDAALARNVPVVSSVQMLDWLDGRNGSSFQGLSFAGGQLRFRIAPAAGATGLEAMVPARSAHGPLLGLTAGGAPVATTPRTVKGIDYAVFPATAADYVATYPAPPAPPQAAPPPARRKKLRTIRATRRGTVKVPVTCRRTHRRCRITVRLRHGGRTVARKTVRVKAGKRVRVTLRLERATRKRLARRGSLVVTLVITGTGRRKSTERVRVRSARQGSSAGAAG